MSRPRTVRVLVAGQAASMLGDGLFAVALAFAVLDATGSDGGLGIVLGAGSLSLVCFLLVGGVVADRASRRGILITADLARVAVQAALALLVASGAARVWDMALLYAAYSVAQAFSWPAWTGFLPQVVDGSRLTAVNGFFHIAFGVAGMVGGVVGGVVVDAVGPAATIAADSATFALSALGFALAGPVPRTPAAPRGRVLTHLAEGFREVMSRGWMWKSILIFALLLTLSIAPLQVVGPVVARSDLGGATAWGMIGASLAAGSLVGAAIAVRGHLRRPMVVAGALLLLSAFTPLLLTGPAPLPLILVTASLEGVAIGISGPVWTTAIQTQIPAERVSRVAAWDLLGSVAGMPAGFLLAGAALGPLGTDGVLVAMAVAGAALAIALLCSADARRIGERPRRQPGRLG